MRNTRLAILVTLWTLMLGSSAFATEKVVLNTQVGEEIRYLDPQKSTGFGSSHISINLFTGLYEYGHKDGAPVPALAKSCDPNKDHSEYVCKLREDFYFVAIEGGKVVKKRLIDANDVVYSYHRILSPELASEYAYMLYVLKNGEAYNKGTIKDSTKVGVTAVDKFTVKLTLEGSVPTLLKYLPHHSFTVVAKEPTSKYGAKWIEPDKIWTSGPYALSEWKLKERITALKNPYYPGAENIQVDEINFKFIGTYSTEAVRAFRAGETDIDYQPPPANEMKALRKSKNLLIARQLGTYYVRVNTTRKGLSNPKVRRALALAIPREKIVEFVMRSGQVPTTSFVPDAFEGYSPATFSQVNTPYMERIKEAKRLLSEVPKKDLPNEFSYVYNTSETHKKVAVVIVKEWKKHLGLNVKPLNEEWKVYLNNQRNLNYDTQRAGWVADMEDPMNFVEMFISGGGNNNTGWSNKQYDKLVDMARREGDAGKRNQYLAEAEAILMDEMPVLPIFNYVSSNLVQSYVSGFHANKLDQHPLKFVKVDTKLRKQMFKNSH